MVRTGFIGCGGIAAAHAPGWREAADAGKAQVVALCDVGQEGMDRLEQALGLRALPRFDQWEAMLAEVELDAVDICLPHHLHAPAILASAAAGRHILCEKPLCLSLEEAARIGAAVEDAGVTLMCAHNQLFIPAIRHMKGAIGDGLIGDVQAVYSADCFRLNRTAAEWGWRGPLATAGGGVLIDTGYHPTYRLLHMAGSRAVAVTAMMHRYHCAIEGEDLANVLVRFENQAIGQILTSWAFPMVAGGWQVAVFGSEGAVFGRGSQFLHQPYEGTGSEKVLPDANTFAEEVKHFVDCLASGSRPVHTHVEGTEVLKVILGAYEAQRSDRTVAL